jgi:bacteriocin resistance YdeI/OmpD-like protein/uncharacterized protein DUF1905
MCPTSPNAAEYRAVRIRAILHARGPAAALILNDAQLEAIGGGRKTPPVRVTVNGHTFNGRIGRMGGETLLGFNKAVRQACGVAAGEEIEALIVLDDAPPQVEVPAPLAGALDADPAARAAFDALAPSHRKEFARWIGEAKRDETRKRRIGETLRMLAEGRTR